VLASATCLVTPTVTLKVETHFEYPQHIRRPASHQRPSAVSASDSYEFIRCSRTNDNSTPCSWRLKHVITAVKAISWLTFRQRWCRLQRSYADDEAAARDIERRATQSTCSDWLIESRDVLRRARPPPWMTSPSANRRVADLSRACMAGRQRPDQRHAGRTLMCHSRVAIRSD